MKVRTKSTGCDSHVPASVASIDLVQSRHGSGIQVQLIIEHVDERALFCECDEMRWSTVAKMENSGRRRGMGAHF